VTSSAAHKQTYTLLIVAEHTYGLPSRPANENLVKVGKHAAYSCSRISERNPAATEICHFIAMCHNIAEIVRMKYERQQASILVRVWIL
jgi:hypothetical protein